MTATMILTNVEMSCNIDAGYGVGLPTGNTEPFPEFCDPSWTLARDSYRKEATAIDATQQKSTKAHIGIDDTVTHLIATNNLNPAEYACTEAWLDNVTATKPFEEVLFFDATHILDNEGLESLSYFNDSTLAHEELVRSSVVFCLSNGEFLYDRAAAQAFIEYDAEVIYWGPEIKSSSRAASLPDPFYSLPSYAPTEDEKENPFSDKNEVPEETLSVDDGDDGDEDDEAESEVSFCCVTAAAHDNTLAKKNARPRIKQSDVLPFRRTFHWIPLKYVNKKKAPPSSIWICSSEKKHIVPIVRPLKSFQRQAPRKDKTVADRAMRVNMCDAATVWPSHLKSFANIQFLPPPRMQARPPRPSAGIFQPVHPEVRVQRETAKPLYLTCISRSPDPLPAQQFLPFELTPDPLHSLDMLRLPSASASVPSTHSLQAECVPAPLQINSRGIYPRPGPYTIQPVDANIRAQWTHVKSQSYHQRHDTKRQCSGVEVNTAGELMLVNVLQERKSRTPLVLKPFRFLRKLLRAAVQKRD
jgi:hypothetical protein